MKMYRNCFAAVFLLVTISKFGACIQCYKCSAVNEAQYVPCSDYEFKLYGFPKVDNCDSCQKVIHPSIGYEVEPRTRGCYNESLCDNLSVCLKCNTDLCNRTNEMKPYHLLLLSTLCGITLYFIK